MKKINDIVKIRQPQRSKARSERDELIERFTEQINRERLGTKWKPITCRAIAVKVGHLGTTELHPFYRQCEEYAAKHGSFSRCFFGALKVRG